MGTSNEFIWAQKYRPKTIDDMVLPKVYKEKFQSYIEEQEIPHLLLYGPNGSGKTTMATILMDEIKCQKLILNASGEDRGIATIKGKVKQFAASQPFAKDYIKIILLDEADFLTAESQTALRNTMETYSSSCRFILTGNYVDKIRKELKSRCTAYEFSQYPVKRLVKHLFEILENEKVKAEKEDIEKLINSFYPDIRSIINNLQMCSADGEFNPNLIASTSIDFDKITEFITNGSVSQLRNLWAGMTDFTFIYRYLFDKFIFEVEEDKRPEIAETIAEYLYRDSAIADREINITMCCVMIMRIIKSKISFRI